MGEVYYLHSLHVGLPEGTQLASELVWCNG